MQAVLELLEEGGTIPFIARYRKDRTGALDEVQIQHIQDEAKAIKEFTERKAFIEKTITEQGKMTDDLQGKLIGVGDSRVAGSETEQMDITGRDVGGRTIPVLGDNSELLCLSGHEPCPGWN